MQLEVGKIYEGKVTGITKFGAFVELDKDTTGMVHISEVANTFVNDIKDHIQEGQTVKVKVLSVGEDKKISLSIKKALPAPPKKQFDRRPGDRAPQQSRPAARRKPYKKGYFAFTVFALVVNVLSLASYVNFFTNPESMDTTIASILVDLMVIYIYFTVVNASIRIKKLRAPEQEE